MTATKNFLKLIAGIAVIAALWSMFGGNVSKRPTDRDRREKVIVSFKVTHDDAKGVVVSWSVGAQREPGMPLYAKSWDNGDTPITARRGDGITLDVASYPNTDKGTHKSCEILVNGVTKEGPWHTVGPSLLRCETEA